MELVEPLLEGVERVDAALVLRGGRPPLEFELAAIHHGAEDGEAARPDVLAAVLQTPAQQKKTDMSN